jgi:hypothetical protein
LPTIYFSPKGAEIFASFQIQDQQTFFLIRLISDLRKLLIDVGA